MTIANWRPQPYLHLWPVAAVARWETARALILIVKMSRGLPSGAGWPLRPPK
jgi:hypothetical protein